MRVPARAWCTAQDQEGCSQPHSRVTSRLGVAMRTRTVRVLLRKKARRWDPRLCVKVVTNCRVPGKEKPVQIHLGYLSLRCVELRPGPDGELPGQSKKLLNGLREKWADYFPDE